LFYEDYLLIKSNILKIIKKKKEDFFILDIVKNILIFFKNIFILQYLKIYYEISWILE
jgi:hypothetical protein